MADDIPMPELSRLLAERVDNAMEGARVETYDPARVRLRLIDLPPEIQGSTLHTTLTMMTEVFEECLNLVARKSMGYGQAWREQGWMGNAARIMSKGARLKGLIWRETPQVMEQAAYESIEDTAMDSINLNAFFLVNRRTSNKWGNNA